MIGGLQKGDAKRIGMRRGIFCARGDGRLFGPFANARGDQTRKTAHCCLRLLGLLTWSDGSRFRSEGDACMTERKMRRDGLGGLGAFKRRFESHSLRPVNETAFVLRVVQVPGVEPGSTASETATLSIVLHLQGTDGW